MTQIWKEITPGIYTNLVPVKMLSTGTIYNPYDCTVKKDQMPLFEEVEPNPAFGILTPTGK